MKSIKTVVVTGGAGFIGSHLTESLAEQAHRVIILDNLSTGKIKNIEHLLKLTNVEFIQGTITDIKLLQTLFRGVQYVFHQAAIPSVPRSIKDPMATHNVNATGTLNVLLAARDNNVRKVVYASSSSVYGDTPRLPKTENMPPNPMSPYAVSKLTGEYYCRVFQQAYGLSTICLRYFNVYGPRQDPESQYAAVIPKFIVKIIRGNPPVIYGDGEQTRDFTFVKDVVKANLLAAESNTVGVFNVARGSRVTINKLIEIITGIVGRGSMTPVYDKPRTGDIKHSFADIAKAKAFDYNPRYGLEEGLKETILSFSNRP